MGQCNEMQEECNADQFSLMQVIYAYARLVVFLL